MNRTFSPDKVVLVTGAGTGIGRATARRFAAEGAAVVAVGRRTGPLEETASGEPRITPLVADITGEGEPDRIIEQTLAHHGRLDVVVNNAGVVSAAAIEAVTANQVQRQFATNVFAPIFLVRAATGALAEANGVIVNVSTAIAQRGWPNNSVYAAGKAAVDTLTRSWAVELAPKGIRVVAVAPGAIDTPIADHQGLSPQQRQEVRQWQLANTPLKRIGSADEVAWAISRLAAVEAGFVTGVVVPIDGGAVVS